jgi:hypothetical protein
VIALTISQDVSDRKHKPNKTLAIGSFLSTATLKQDWAFLIGQNDMKSLESLK